MRVCWEVEDGYCGGSRYQWTVVPDEELADCEDRDEQDILIDEYIGEDFANMGYGRVEINDDPYPEPGLGE